MAIDPTRAGFVKNEYRWPTVEDTSIKDDFTQSTTLDVPSNLGLSDAQEIAESYFDLVGHLCTAFEVQMETAISLDDFADGPPCYTCNFTPFQTDDRTYRGIRYECDPITGRTTMVIFG